MFIRLSQLVFCDGTVNCDVGTRRSYIVRRCSYCLEITRVNGLRFSTAGRLARREQFACTFVILGEPMIRTNRVSTVSTLVGHPGAARVGFADDTATITHW